MLPNLYEGNRTATPALEARALGGFWSSTSLRPELTLASYLAVPELGGVFHVSLKEEIGGTCNLKLVVIASGSAAPLTQLCLSFGVGRQLLWDMCSQMDHHIRVQHRGFPHACVYRLAMCLSSEE